MFSYYLLEPKKRYVVRRGVYAQFMYAYVRLVWENIRYVSFVRLLNIKSSCPSFSLPNNCSKSMADTTNSSCAILLLFTSIVIIILTIILTTNIITIRIKLMMNILCLPRHLLHLFHLRNL